MGSVAGWHGRVNVGGTNLCATRWQLTWKVDDLDVTCFEHGAVLGTETPVSKHIPGITDIDVMFDCYWENNIDVFSNIPPFLQPGSFANVDLYLDKASASAYWDTASVLITDVVMDTEVRGVIKYSVTGKHNGQVPVNFVPKN